MASPFEDVVSGFDLEFLTPTIEVSEHQCRHREQRSAIKRVKMRTIATDTVIKKYTEIKLALEKAEIKFSESREECKNTYIEYTNAIQKVAFLEEEAKKIQDVNDDLQKKNLHAENQCNGLLANAKQLQIMIKELENKIDALEIENNLAKTTPKDLENKITALQNDKKVMLKHILILRAVVFGKKQLDRGIKVILRKYEKLCNDLSLYEDTDECAFDAEDTVAWTEAVDANHNQDQESLDSDAVITQIVIETIPDPESLESEGEIEKMALTADVDISAHNSEQGETPCITADNRDRDSEDTGRGSSLAFSGSEKSPEYSNHVSPMCPESIFKNNTTQVVLETMSRSTSPIVFESAFNVALRDVATSPVLFENAIAIGEHKNKTMEPPKRPVEKVTPEFIKSLDEITKPLYFKPPPVKIVEDEFNLLAFDHCDEEDAHDDSEVLSILDNINLHYNLITPLPISPKTVRTPRRPALKQSPAAGQITAEEMNHFRKIIPDLQNHMSVLTKLVNRNNLCSTTTMHKPSPRSESVPDTDFQSDLIDNPKIVIEFVDDTNSSVPEAITGSYDVETRKEKTAKIQESCDVESIEETSAKSRGLCEVTNLNVSEPVTGSCNVETRKEKRTKSQGSCDVESIKDTAGECRGLCEITNLSVPKAITGSYDVETRKEKTAKSQESCDVESTEETSAQSNDLCESFNLSVPEANTGSCELVIRKERTPKGRISVDDYTKEKTPSKCRGPIDVESTDKITAKIRRSCDVETTERRTAKNGRSIDVETTNERTAKSRNSCDFETRDDRTANTRGLCVVETTLEKTTKRRGSCDDESGEDISTKRRGSCDVENTENRKRRSRIQLIFGDMPLSDDDDDDVEPLMPEKDHIVDKVVDENITEQERSDTIPENESNVNDASSKICDNNINYDDVSINGLVREHRRKKNMSKLEKMRKWLVPKNKIKMSESPKKRLRDRAAVKSISPKLVKSKNGNSAVLNDKAVYAKAVAVAAELRAQQKKKQQSYNQKTLLKRTTRRTDVSDGSETNNKHDEFESINISTNVVNDTTGNNINHVKRNSYSETLFEEYMVGHDLIRDNKKLLFSEEPIDDNAKGKGLIGENNNLLSTQTLSMVNTERKVNEHESNKRLSLSEVSPSGTITAIRSRICLVSLNRVSLTNLQDKISKTSPIKNTTKSCGAVGEVLGSADHPKIKEQLSSSKPLETPTTRRLRSRNIESTKETSQKIIEPSVLDSPSSSEPLKSQQRRSSLKRPSSKLPEGQIKRRLRSTSLRLSATDETQHKDVVDDNVEPPPVLDRTDRRIPHKDYSDLDMFRPDTPNNEPKQINIPKQEAKQVNVDQIPNGLNDSVMCRMIGKYSRKTYKKSQQKLKLNEKTITAVCTKIEKAAEEIKGLQQSATITVEMDRLVDSMKSYDHKIFLSGLLKYLNNPDRKAELFMKCSLPSGPGMSKSEQILLYLITHLKGNWPSINLVGEVLRNIEYALFRLNCSPEFDVIESLSHFYAVLCRYTANRNRLRIFMLDAMYCIGYKAMALIKQCLEVWMHVLPLAHMSTAKNPVVTVLVFLLHFYKCEDRYNRVTDIRKILHRQYFYSMAEWSEHKLLDVLRTAILELQQTPTQQMMLRISLIILAKRQGPQWCLKTLLGKVLMPIVEREGGASETSQAFCLSLLGALVKPFAPHMSVHCEIVMNQLFDMLGHNRSQKVEEAIFTSLLNMSKHSGDRVVEALLAWRPKHAISEELEILLKSFVRQKTTSTWKTYMSRFAFRNNRC